MEIIYSGGSHYGEKALRSIQRFFNRVYILSSNPSGIIHLKRENDVLINDFSESNCRFVFLGGHSEFITKEQLKVKTYINVHGALLPKYRGMHPTFWAIMNGEDRLGVTFHLVDEYMDSGDILAQYSFDYNGQIIREINKEIDDLIEKHAGEVVYQYILGKIIPVEQNNEQATFGCKRNLDDCLIDFNMDNHLLERFFIALTPPYPLPRLVIKGKTYEVLKYRIIERKYVAAIGRVLNISDDGIWIKTKDGFLIVSLLREVDSNELVDPKKLVRIGYRLFP